MSTAQASRVRGCARKAQASLVFPGKFAWGVSTAAPQIEGAARAAGKSESNWDHFARQPGRIANGDTPEVACDHYHRYRSDVALMKSLGVRHYRLSLAWPRIIPAGDGAVNRKGVGFYDRLLDALGDAGITPWVTMFHWDLPQSLEARGGWRTRQVVDAFARYADTIVRAYGDRVKHWITLNETSCFTRQAYGGTTRPPAANEPEAVINQTYHHAMLAHGHGVRAVREHGGRGSRVGLTDDARIFVPVIENAANIAAARAAFVDANVRVLDPIYRGHYSPDYFRVTGRDRAVCAKGDFALIGLRTDFLGLNIYTGSFVRAGKRGRPEILPWPKGYPEADARWLKHVPQAMYWGPRLVRETYGVKAIYITENGAGYDDAPPANGEVMDLHRREYVRHCLGELHRAVREGLPVRGYFLWSLLDNFEWADGYARRFGIVYNDFQTQRRTPKLSARWYAEVMRRNRLV
jgi:beta-glucosidase